MTGGYMQLKACSVPTMCWISRPICWLETEGISDCFFTATLVSMSTMMFFTTRCAAWICEILSGTDHEVVSSPRSLLLSEWLSLLHSSREAAVQTCFLKPYTLLLTKSTPSRPPCAWWIPVENQFILIVSSSQFFSIQRFCKKAKDNSNTLLDK